MKRFVCRMLALILICLLITLTVAGCHGESGQTQNLSEGDANKDTQVPLPQQPCGPVSRFLVAEQCKYYSDGELYSKSSYTYDEKGRLLSYHCENYLSDKVDSYSYSYQYNDCGLLETETHSFWEGRKTVRNFDYTYNPDGSVAFYQCNVRDYMPNETTPFAQHFEAEYAFIYDSEGKLTQYISRVGSIKFESKRSFVYDDNGRLTEILDHHETYDFSTVFEYSSNGQLLSANGNGMATRYEYNAEGQLSHKTGGFHGWTYAYTDGIISRITFETDSDYGDTKARTYTLNDDGSVKEIKWSNGRRTTYQYTSVTLDAEESRSIVRYWDLVNEKLTWADYVQNIAWAFLPKADPFAIS